MLIYGDATMTNDIVLTGGSNSLFEGSVYALGSHCDVEGNGGAVAINTQVICDTVRINGTGDLDIFYDETRNYHIPAAVDLSQLCLRIYLDCEVSVRIRYPFLNSWVGWIKQVKEYARERVLDSQYENE